MELLLKDHTTNKNIFWTDTGKEITIEDYTSGKIKPRIEKAKAEQTKRTKAKAEVFTPTWICKDMIDMIDSECKNLSWQEYVRSKRLEITCGEAPFLVSRYDTTTGEYLPISKRIGILDRKLCMVNRNTDSYIDWLVWTIIAYKSTYGYEYQGDNLLLARVNLSETFVDYYKDKWDEEPKKPETDCIDNIISWNLWQMDGLKNCVPNTDIKCKIFDWDSEKEILFEDIKNDRL